ncbi:hypothetical protein PTTG_25259 [Puccinia triticina 1-1 BBBD Race 1]|uniref:Uncharacterized protein n=1 Tax=Puccinia triticina (isolate 1-1 / race 1 (BBBD)) TaxID=630390 RepID=A0A180H3X9_PUCT1|nr:hypothetical protein PTTG_25259 [Puccinia triticina 1-1 BBBD Race 1]
MASCDRSLMVACRSAADGGVVHGAARPMTPKPATSNTPPRGGARGAERHSRSKPTHMGGIHRQKSPGRNSGSFPDRRASRSTPDDRCQTARGNFLHFFATPLAMTDQMKEASNHVKRLAQASAEDTPDLDEPLIQREIAETLTLKPQKQKKTKATAPTNRTTRSSSKAPPESRPLTEQPTPKEGPVIDASLPLANREEAHSSRGNALASLCSNLFNGPRNNGTAANPVDADAAEHPTTTGGSSIKESIRKKIDWLTDQAFAAEDAGNTALAKIYFAICEGLTKPKILPAASSRAVDTPHVHPTLLAIRDPVAIIYPALDSTGKEGQARGTDATPKGVVFDDDARPASHNVWQDKAILHYSQKRSRAYKTNVNKDRYTGYPYPCEYTQTYAEWSINHQGFYATLIEIANYPKFAGWLLLHKRHCDRLVTQHGFITGLRYDINVRTNAFAHRIEMPNKSISISNISVFNNTIAQKMVAHCRKFDETDFTENPYIKGGPRKAWDPVTGTESSKLETQVTTGGQAGKGQQQGHSPPNNRGSAPSSGQYPRTQGYKGNQYDPAYNDRNTRRDH